MISDEEIIYNIHIKRRGAIELLFFVYEKKLGFLISKYESLFRKLDYEYDDIKLFIDNSVNQALKRYSLTSGKFFYFVVTVTERNIIDLYRHNASKIEMNCQLVDLSDIYEEDFTSFLSSSDASMEEHYDYEEIMEMVSKMRNKEEEKKVIFLLCLGYSYEEISLKTGLCKKKVSNIIQAVRESLRKTLKK